MLKNGYFSLLIILFCYSQTSGRQLDLQYSHMGLPFAVFYNPLLIHDNSGVAFGADAIYADKNNHDVRTAVSIPVVNVDNIASAFSVGILYDSYNNYQISTGFGAYTKHFRFGSSFDIINYDKNGKIGDVSNINDINDIENPGDIDVDIDTDGDIFIYDYDKLGLSVNLAFGRDIMKRGVVSLIFRNILVDERNENNPHGLTLGFGGALNPNLLLNTHFTGYISKGEAKRKEGGASLSFYIPQFILKNDVDYSMNASAGFDIVRNQGQKINNKFFLNVGVSFFKKPALAAAVAGVHKNDNYFALLYNSNKKLHDASTLYTSLKFTESNSGKHFFHLECGGGKIVSWILSLEDGSGKVIRTFSGGNVVPQTIEWDGSNYKGESIENQAVRAKLIVRDERKTVRESETVIIRR